MSGLTSEQKQQYDELGYVLLKGLFDAGELQPLIDELDTEIDRIARAYHADGLTESLYADEGFETRFMRIVKDAEQAYREMVDSKFLGPEVFRLLSHPAFLDIVEDIVGPEVHCQGRHRLRPKLPNFGVADFRWHEDTEYATQRVTYVQQQYGLDRTASKTGGKFMSRIVAAPRMPEPNFWVPLVPVDERNGCLHVLPGGHLHTPPYEEQWEPNTYVDELNDLEPLVVPMEVGDALLMHQHVPHVSPPNRTNAIRWSIDIRYQDGSRPVKSVREPGFLARSVERPQDVVTDYEGYKRIRDAVAEFRATSGIRF
ncbi:MAG: phytanoyl-CoA dioxygenase family protein [Dehalococcoidia bacterium]|nr:phytanoyl-CoA dioxygenase family protein [Dehalococcoidia bacterium]